MKSAFESASAEVGRYRGLTESEVAASREANGRNLLEMPPGKPAWKLFLEKFRDPVIVILIVAALISMFTGAVIESIGILLAVLLAPSVLVTAALAALALSARLPVLAVLLAGIHLSGCAGDILMAMACLREGSCTHVRDTETGITLLSEREETT